MNVKKDSATMDHEERYNMSCCFQDSNCSLPITPKLNMAVGVGDSRKVFKLWLDCYLLENKGIDGK